jgi:hypothetical protein
VREKIVQQKNKLTQQFFFLRKTNGRFVHSEVRDMCLLACVMQARKQCLRALAYSPYFLACW